MSKPLWTYEDFLAGLKGRGLSTRPAAITGISIDSRTIARGDAFFAIAGDRFDGHDFVTQALASGAATAVVAEDRVAALGSAKGSLTVVPDVLAALGNLGRAARARSSAGIVAVTGSVGKTGTKEMLARGLATEGEVHYSPASFNNHWGVPLTLSRMPESARFAVFEIGMNHPGEIDPLVRMVRPHAAIITTVEPVHLEYFKDVGEIAKAKAEIFNGLVPGGAAIVNCDNPHYAALVAMAEAAGVSRIIAFGEQPDADVRLEKVRLLPNCSCIAASILGEAVTYKLGAPGRHVVQNSLAVMAAVSVLGADLAKAALALGEMPAPKGRGARHALDLGVGAPAVLIDESYNANPASMGAAIALLGQAVPTGEGRRLAVLGDMRELGADSAAMHAGLAGDLAKARVDKVFLAGPLMASLRDALPLRRIGGYAETAKELEPLLFESIVPGDVIMVKGSNASRMGALVEALKARFAGPRTEAEDRQGQEIA